MAKASSLRPHIVQLAAANKGRILSTDDIYRSVADLGVAGFDPKSMRDRNLVNRELSDLAGCSTQGHSKPALQILTRVSRGYYLYREPTLPMEVVLLQEYLEPLEVYEKRPPRPRHGGSDRRRVSVEVREALYEVQRGVCPGCGFYQPDHRRFEADHIVALGDDGKDQVRNLQLLCGHCNRTKATRGGHGFMMKMAELRAYNVAERMMVDETLAALTGPATGSVPPGSEQARGLMEGAKA